MGDLSGVLPIDAEGRGGNERGEGSVGGGGDGEGGGGKGRDDGGFGGGGGGSGGGWSGRGGGGRTGNIQMIGGPGIAHHRIEEGTALIS